MSEARAEGETRTALVLRPEPGLSATLDRVASQAGWRGVGVPLTRREATGTPRPAAPFDAIALTSAEGARSIPRHDVADLQRRPVHCIGAATASAAREHGLHRGIAGLNGTPAASGGELGRILGDAFAGGTLLYPCAVERRPDFEREAIAGGASVLPWPVYRTLVDDAALEDVEALLRSQRVDATLLHAPSAARALGHVATFSRTGTLMCLSQAVADALPGHAAGSVVVAERPTDAALVSLLWKVPR